MEAELSSHDCLFANLKMMGFGAYLRYMKQKSFTFNRDLFTKANQKAFEFVTHFLFKTMKHTDCLNDLKGCFPCKDKKQEADFRKIVMKYFKKLESEKDFDHKFLPVLIHNPGGDQFAQLYLCFTNYVIKRVLLKGYNVAELSMEELRDRAQQDIEELQKSSRIFYEEKAQLLDGITYFVKQIEFTNQQLAQDEAELEEINKRLIDMVGFCEPDKLMKRIEDNFSCVESLMKPFATLVQQMDLFLEHEFENEKLILDVAQIAETEKTMDLQKKYSAIKAKLEAFKSILHKDYAQIIRRNSDFITKNTILREINTKLEHVSDQLIGVTDELNSHYEVRKQEFLGRDDVKERIEKIKQAMHINFPKLHFEPQAPKTEESQTFAPKVTFLDLSNATNKKINNRRVSIYDFESSMIDFCDISGYNFNPPSDNEMSFSITDRIQESSRRKSMRRQSTIFDRNFELQFM